MLTNNKKSMKMPKSSIKIRNSKLDRYYNCQKDKDKDKKTKQRSTNTSQKTKFRAILSPIKSRINSNTQEG